MAIPTLLLGGVVLVLAQYPSLPLAETTPEEDRMRMLMAIIVLAPILATAFLCWAFYLTNRMVGPVDRMIQELDARVRGSASGPIILRPKDLLLPLAERINLVIAEWEKLKKSQSS